MTTRTTESLIGDRLGTPGQVRLVRVNVADTDDALAGLAAAARGDSSRRSVTVAVEHLGVVKSLIDQVLAELAGVAGAVWPDWYGDDAPFGAFARSGAELRSRLPLEFGRSDRLRAAANAAWVEAANDRCLRGKQPLPSGFPSAVQAAQLALALGPGPLVAMLGLRDVAAGGARLLGLARAAEWLARVTGAAVLVAVPASLADAPELAAIGYRATDWPAAEGPPAADEAVDRVWPVLGRPHPYSPGEQLLAERLARDEELAPLFAFNRRVRSRRGGDFIADLLWEGGKVVVEVDGYRHHANRYAFVLDRRRDYELTVSGYLVLRLPHDELMEDVELAVDKIRDFVRFRRSQPGGPGGIAP